MLKQKMCKKYAVFLFIYFFQISFSKTHRLISICGKTCKIVAKSMAVVTYTCRCIPAYMHVCMATGSSPYFMIIFFFLVVNV